MKNKMIFREKMAHRRATKIARNFRREKMELMKIHHIPEDEAVSAIRYYIATIADKRIDCINKIIRATPTVLLAIVSILLITKIA